MDAGIPKEKPAMTLNIVCGSGLRSVSLARQMILAGDVESCPCRWYRINVSSSIPTSQMKDGELEWEIRKQLMK